MSVELLICSLNRMSNKKKKKKKRKRKKQRIFADVDCLSGTAYTLDKEMCVTPEKNYYLRYFLAVVALVIILDLVSLFASPYPHL